MKMVVADDVIGLLLLLRRPLVLLRCFRHKEVKIPRPEFDSRSPVCDPLG